MVAVLAVALAAATIVASALAFGAMLLDKRAAVRGRRRVPEARLHLLELLGGWPGSLLAQRLVRHKTRWGAYRVTFLAIVVLHAALWAGLALLALRGR